MCMRSKLIYLVHVFLGASKYFSLFILIPIVGCVILLGYFWYDNLDPQGGENSYCNSVEIEPVRNKSGMVVSAHNTVCDGFGGSSAIYVYVHQLGQNESKNSLVFRYADIASVSPPKFEWISNDSLHISVDNVSQVTKQLYLMEGMKISYSIGNEDYPRQN